MIVYSDLHLFGTHKKIDIDLEFGPEVFYIGDIVDIKNCRKKNINEAKQLLEKIEKNAGKNYIAGNHELKKGSNEYIIYKNILLCHGDIFLWSKERYLKWRNGSIKPGKSDFIRFLLRLKNCFVRFRIINLNENVLNKIYKYVLALDKGVNTVIIGHEHPNKIIKKKIAINNYPEITIIIVPRGKNYIDI